MVRFEQRNLVLEDPAFWRAGAFDIVFCRNVVMYFDVETMRSVIGRIANATNARGFLFLGHAETLRGISNDFHLRHSHETFYYERKGESDHAANRPREETRSETRGAFVALPSVRVAEDASWVDVIQRASERVAKLSTAQTPPRATRDERVDLGWREKILEMVRAERFAEALELLGTRDEDPESRLLRAVLLTNRGDLALAESICGDILAIDDLNAGAHYVKALCREHAGDRESAIEHDRMATYLEPTFTMPHIHIGLLERRAGRLDRARAEIVRALQLIAAEDPSRILLFGGGFSREALATLCRNELRRCGGAP
jgi:chemotaxis protein methyltransferase CheR